MSKLVKVIPESVSRDALDRHEGVAIFWHEIVDEESGAIMIALVLRGAPFLHVIRDFHFETDEDVDVETCRLNRLLGYNLIQMVSLKCGHLNREEGEPIVFSGHPPNCTVSRDEYW